MRVTVAVQQPDNVTYHYTMESVTDDLLTGLSDGTWREIRLLEIPPEIRRGHPVIIRIRREE